MKSRWILSFLALFLAGCIELGPGPDGPKTPDEATLGEIMRGMAYFDHQLYGVLIDPRGERSLADLNEELYRQELAASGLGSIGDFRGFVKAASLKLEIREMDFVICLKGLGVILCDRASTAELTEYRPKDLDQPLESYLERVE